METYGGAVVTLASHRWSVRLGPIFGHADITSQLQTLVRESGLHARVITVQLIGSTGAITTIEYESDVRSTLLKTSLSLPVVDRVKDLASKDD